MIESDYDLVKKVKESQDSTALNELIDRHSGIYLSILDNNSYVPTLERHDIIADKSYNIYKYAMDYDPSRNMKFSVYIGQRLKWHCIDVANKSVDTEPVVAETLVAGPDFSDESAIRFIIDNTSEITDKRFFEIFKRRHLGDKKESWKKIGQALGLTYEGARKIYLRNIKFLRARLKKENLGGF